MLHVSAIRHSQITGVFESEPREWDDAVKRQCVLLASIRCCRTPGTVSDPREALCSMLGCRTRSHPNRQLFQRTEQCLLVSGVRVESDWRQVVI